MSVSVIQPPFQLRIFKASPQGFPKKIKSLHSIEPSHAISCHILYIQKGKIKIRLHQTEIDVSEGDSIAVHPSFDVLSCSSTAGWTQWDLTQKLVQEALRKYELCLSGNKSSYGKDLCRLNDDPLFQHLIPSVINCLGLAEEVRESLLLLKAEELLITLFNKPAYSGFCSRICREFPEKTSSLLDILSAEFTENRSLDAWAYRCHMSTSTFKRRCKEILGTSPVRWLQQRRLEHATKLLSSPRLQINEVAYSSGFENTSHFIQSFKQRYGCTPAQYREKKARSFRKNDLEMT